MAFFQKLFGPKDNRRGKISLPDENDELHFSPNLPSQSSTSSGIEDDFGTTYNPNKPFSLVDSMGSMQVRESKYWSDNDNSSVESASDEEEAKTSIGLPDLDSSDNNNNGGELAAMSRFRANFGIFSFHKNRWAARVMQFDLLQKQVRLIHGKNVTVTSFDVLHPATPDQHLSQIFFIRSGEGKPAKYRVQTELDRKMILDLTAHIASYYQTKSSSTKETEREFLDALEKTLSNHVHKTGFTLHKNGVKWGRRELELEVFRDKPELAHISIYMNKDDDHIPIRTVSIFSVEFLANVGENVINLHASGRILEFKFRTKSTRDEWFSEINKFLLAARPNFILGSQRMSFKELHRILKPSPFRGISLKQCSITIAKEENLKMTKSTSFHRSSADPARASVRSSRIGETHYPPLPVHLSNDFTHGENDLDDLEYDGGE
eukprot:TRINITY_DN7373_c0_g1_i2.p1 TRINITY_DN7373_c0_g1~~TRINITY_DN7373_c0_g1_i2.p1  ORF type:complete len:434 (+),score=103.25 TRINITY_DN7373_c0_g1_i2:196-1497(+)